MICIIFKKRKLLEIPLLYALKKINIRWNKLKTRIYRTPEGVTTTI